MSSVERKAEAKLIHDTAVATRKAQRMLAADKDALEVPPIPTSLPSPTLSIADPIHAPHRPIFMHLCVCFVCMSVFHTQMKKYADLHKGAEREIVAQQKAERIAAIKQDEVKQTEAELRKSLAEKQRREKEEFMRKYDQRCASLFCSLFLSESRCLIVWVFVWQ